MFRAVVRFLVNPDRVDRYVIFKIANDLPIFKDEYKKHILQQNFIYQSSPTGAWQANVRDFYQQNPLLTVGNDRGSDCQHQSQNNSFSTIGRSYL